MPLTAQTSRGGRGLGSMLGEQFQLGSYQGFLSQISFAALEKTQNQSLGEFHV